MFKIGQTNLALWSHYGLQIERRMTRWEADICNVSFKSYTKEQCYRGAPVLFILCLDEGGEWVHLHAVSLLQGGIAQPLFSAHIQSVNPGFL